MTVEQVRGILLEQCERSGSQRKWANKHGFSEAYVSDIARGRRDPGPKILSVLGLKKRIYYVEENAGPYV